MASSRDTAEFNRKNMFHVHKTISREKLFAFVGIGKRLQYIFDLCCNVGYSLL